jgi:hypothetical protein
LDSSAVDIEQRKSGLSASRGNVDIVGGATRRAVRVQTPGISEHLLR